MLALPAWAVGGQAVANTSTAIPATDVTRTNSGGALQQEPTIQALGEIVSNNTAPNAAASEKQNKVNSKTIAKWTNEEEVLFFDVLKGHQNSTSEECKGKIAQAIASKSLEQVGVYYNRMIRQINSILGANQSLNMNDHLSVHRAMLKYRAAFNGLQNNNRKKKSGATEAAAGGSKKRRRTQTGATTEGTGGQHTSKNASLKTDGAKRTQGSKEGSKGKEGKIHLSLAPLNPQVAQMMRDAGYAEFLDLHVSKSKSLASLLDHLSKKWSRAVPGGMSEAITLHASVGTSEEPSKVWGGVHLGEQRVEVSEIHEALAFPDACELKYSWDTAPAPSAVSGPAQPSRTVAELRKAVETVSAVAPPPIVPTRAVVLQAAIKAQTKEVVEVPPAVEQQQHQQVVAPANKSFMEMLQDDTNDGFQYNMDYDAPEYEAEPESEPEPAADPIAEPAVAAPEPIAAPVTAPAVVPAAPSAEEQQQPCPQPVVQPAPAAAASRPVPFIRRALWAGSKPPAMQRASAPKPAAAQVVQPRVKPTSARPVEATKPTADQQLMPPPPARQQHQQQADPPMPPKRAASVLPAPVAAVLETARQMPLPAGMLELLLGGQQQQAVEPTTTAPTLLPDTQQQQPPPQTEEADVVMEHKPQNSKEKIKAPKKTKSNNSKGVNKSPTKKSAGTKKPKKTNSKGQNATKPSNPTGKVIAPITAEKPEQSNASWLEPQCPSPPIGFELPEDFPGFSPPAVTSSKKKSAVAGMEGDLAVKGVDALFKDMMCGTRPTAAAPTTAGGAGGTRGGDTNLLLLGEHSKLSLLDGLDAGFSDMSNPFGSLLGEKESTWLGAFDFGTQQGNQRTPHRRKQEESTAKTKATNKAAKQTTNKKDKRHFASLFTK